jgi:hypothetical protein
MLALVVTALINEDPYMKDLFAGENRLENTDFAFWQSAFKTVGDADVEGHKSIECHVTEET